MSAPLIDLLAPLFDGVFDEPPWAHFLEQLRVAIGADYTSVTFRPPGKPLNAVLHLYAGEPAPPLLSQHYHEHLHAFDPLPYYRLIEGRVYALDELLRAGEPAHDTYYRDFLVPSGMSVLKMMRVTEAGGVNAWLALSRRSGDFASGHVLLLEELAPYLRSALRTLVGLERERFNAAIADEAIRRLGFGWLALDASARVVDADSQGVRLLAQSDVLGRKSDGRLAARPKLLERQITSGVRALASGAQSRPRAIILSRDPWLDMLLVPAHRRALSAKPDPAVIAYIHGDSGSSADRYDQLAELFGLTPGEARLALALSRGMTIAEAAAEQGLTLETGRNYSKKIYAKLGARGQSDVVRFIMRSVLSIA